MPIMKRIIRCLAPATVLVVSSAQASVFWPEQAAPLTEAEIRSLESKGLVQRSPVSDPYVIIDDQRFQIDHLRLSGFSGRRWTDGVLYYKFSKYVKKINRDRFLSACSLWTSVANVRCALRTGSGPFLLVQNGGGSNWSDVGMPKVSGTLGMTSWSKKYIIAHEIGHALGMSHEQCRTNRNKFVEILEENICCDAQGNFDIKQTDNYGNYDFDSVMHYWDTEWGKKKNGKRLRTIRVLPPHESWQNRIGQRDHLSSADAAGMAARYGPPRHIR